MTLATTLTVAIHFQGIIRAGVGIGADGAIGKIGLSLAKRFSAGGCGRLGRLVLNPGRSGRDGFFGWSVSDDWRD